MKINLILLASGFSRRFNKNKLLTDFKGKPLYMHVIDTVTNMTSDYQCKKVCYNENEAYIFSKIICVTQYKEIEKNLKDKKSGIYVVINNNAYLGISSSIKAGISYDTEADGYMFMVCDQPYITQDTVFNIIEEFVQGKKEIVAAGIKYEKKLSEDEENITIGNPVVFSKKYIGELMKLTGDKGGKKVVMNHLDDVEIVYCRNISELQDIDTYEDYKILNNK